MLYHSFTYFMSYLVDVRAVDGTGRLDYSWVCVSEAQAHFTAQRYISDLGVYPWDYTYTVTPTRYYSPGEPVFEYRQMAGLTAR